MTEFLPASVPWRNAAWARSAVKCANWKSEIRNKKYKSEIDTWKSEIENYRIQMMLVLENKLEIKNF